MIEDIEEHLTYLEKPESLKTSPDITIQIKKYSDVISTIIGEYWTSSVQ